MCLLGVMTFDLVFTFDFEVMDFKLMTDDKVQFTNDISQSACWIVFILNTHIPRGM